MSASFNGRNDLTIDGRKFSGNAQYRLGDCIVHHGSLLFDTDIRQMVEATTPDSYKITSKSIKSVRDRVTNISDHLPQPMDPETFKETMVRHIMNGSRDTYAVTPEDDRPHPGPARKNSTAGTVSSARTPNSTLSALAALQGEKFNLKSRSGRVSSAAPRFTATFFHSGRGSNLLRAARLPL
ncbi:MAG: biotin/lipoate A/B protein ligase family protein [Oscillospiraceae bacterium]